MSAPLSGGSDRPTSVTLIAIVNAIGFVVTIGFWAFIYAGGYVPMPSWPAEPAERANAATTFGFMIGDLLFSAPLLLLGSVGLWRLRPWGWTAAQLANVLWVFTLTVILVRDLHTWISPGGVLFLPFALFALWAGFLLWKKRNLFWSDTTS
jgi:hypothetical protein